MPLQLFEFALELLYLVTVSILLGRSSGSFLARMEIEDEGPQRRSHKAAFLLTIATLLIHIRLALFIAAS